MSNAAKSHPTTSSTGDAFTTMQKLQDRLDKAEKDKLDLATYDRSWLKFGMVTAFTYIVIFVYGFITVLPLNFIPASVLSAIVPSIGINLFGLWNKLGLFLSIKMEELQIQQRATNFFFGPCIRAREAFHKRATAAVEMSEVSVEGAGKKKTEEEGALAVVAVNQQQGESKL